MSSPQPTPPSPLILDGQSTSAHLRSNLRSLVQSFQSSHPSSPRPTLAVVLVGTRKDSETYVKMKTKACEEVGIDPRQINIDEKVSEEELIHIVTSLNADAAVHGILVQLPLPSHIHEDRIIALISPHKDVDGLVRGTTFIPCTPLGCLEILEHYGIPMEGKHAVVVGRSNLVGKPVALLLLSRNATVTMCHSKTKDLPSFVKQADIVVAAIGKPEFIKGEWLKEGAVVVDVGINPVEDKSKKSGFRLVGDVDFAECKKRASAITPVPGGIGPMTVCMLMKNTLRAYESQTELKIL